MDMYIGYVKVACEQLPHAQIVIVRFHVARAYRDCADKPENKNLNGSSKSYLTMTSSLQKTDVSISSAT